MTARVLRVGVAGLGAVAQAVHLPLLARRYDLFEIGAVCDFSAGLAATLGDRYGVPDSRRFTSLDDLLGVDDLDAVLLLTSGSHGPAAAAALRRGLPVFCEKPLAFSQAEADELLQITAGSDRPMLQVGYMKQYDPATQRLTTFLDEVEGLRAVDVEVLHPADAAQLAFANLLPRPVDVPEGALAAALESDARAARAALGDVPPEVTRLYTGILLGSLIHDVSLLRMLVGVPQSVDLVRTWPDGVAPGSVDVAGTFSDATRYSMRWHFIPDYPAYRETVTLHHATGSLSLVFAAPYLLNAPTELVRVDATGGEDRSVWRSTVEAFEEELVAFHAMVTEGRAPLSGIAEGRTDIETSQRIARRYAEDRGITVGGEAAAR